MILKLIAITCLLSLNISGTIYAFADEPTIAEEVENAVIIGSAEHPDPVLTRVQELEKKGILKNVIVMESFPVQIKVTGPKNIIKELRAMPRKVSPNFK